MSISRKTWLRNFLSIAAILFLFLGYRQFFGHSKPLDYSPRAEFSSTLKTADEIESFVSGNFAIINRMEDLPASVSVFYKEADGKRFTIANPGERFEATDVIYDASVPRRRLIFAGVVGDKCFVHYEEGGRGLHSDLDLFKLTSPARAESVRSGTCLDVSERAVKDVVGLKKLVASGDCQHH
jgi:hypothetical protein